MKISALAIVALMATEASAFVPASSRTARKLNGARASFSKNKPLHMADEYNLDTGAPKTVTLTGNAARLEKLRADLEREIVEAEADRSKVLQEIAEAEARRRRLEAEAIKVLSDVEARRKRLAILEEQAARASLIGGAGPVVGGLGAIAATVTAARSALATREKVLEEKRQQAEEASLTVEGIKGKAGGFVGFALAAVSILCLLRF
jgi:hypothetical protein